MPYFYRFACLLLAFWGAGSSLALANNCTSPLNLTAGGTSVNGTIDATADYIGNAQHPCPGPGATGDVWYRMSLPSGSNQTNYNIDFAISGNFTGTINAILLYSESKDVPGSTVCDFQGASSLTGLTRYMSEVTTCGISLTGGTQTLSTIGLDGSGTFFLLIERVSGSGGTVTVTANIAGTCTPPPFDDCDFCKNNGPSLTLGNGIDPNFANAAVAASWSDGFLGTTQCATKERFQSACGSSGPPTPTEDHYGCRLFGNCFYNGNVGDAVNCPFPGSQIDTWLENTVYYSFQAPSTDFWYIHFGSSGPCQQEPNNLAIALLSSLDCNNARLSNRLLTNKFPVAGGLPNPNGTLGSVFLTSGTTYYIVVDGIRASQCDFQLLITPKLLNLILPVTLEAFQGWNEGGANQLRWETSQESQFDYFEVERSLNGKEFQALGQRKGQGESSSRQFYTFRDPHAPLGKAYYRLNMVDLNGKQSYSDILEINRMSANFAIEEVYPNPFRDELHIRFTVVNDDPVWFRFRDLTGRETAAFSFRYSVGTHTVSLPTATLAAGLYLLEYSQEDHQGVIKVVK